MSTSPAVEEAARLPSLPQPARHVRDRAAVVADGRASSVVALDAPAPAAERGHHQPLPRRPAGRDLLARRLAGVAARPDAERDPRRHGRRVAVLRPAPVRGRLLGERRELGVRGRGAARELLPEAAAALPVLHRQHRPPPRPPLERQKVPNYNLQRAHDENPIFRDVPVLTARDGAVAVRLKLIDPDAGRLLTWSEVRARRAAVLAASPAAL